MTFESALSSLEIEKQQLAIESLSKLDKSGFLDRLKSTQERDLLTIARQAGGDPSFESQLIVQLKTFNATCDFIDGLHKLLIET